MKGWIKSTVFLTLKIKTGIDRFEKMGKFNGGFSECVELVPKRRSI